MSDHLDDAATERLRGLVVARSSRGSARGAADVLAGAEALVDEGGGRIVGLDVASIPDGRRPPRRAVVAAAAAIVLVVGVVAVVAEQRDDSLHVARTTTVAPSRVPPAPALARWSEAPPLVVPAGHDLVEPVHPIALNDGPALLMRSPAGLSLAILRLSSGRWETTPNSPAATAAHVTSVWTGRELVVHTLAPNDDSRDLAYDPAAQSWRVLSGLVDRWAGSSFAPPPHAVWNGSRVISWDGYGEVVSWDPVTDTAEVLRPGVVGDGPFDTGDGTPQPTRPAWTFWHDNRLVVAGGKPVRAAMFDIGTRRWTRYGPVDDRAIDGAAGWSGSELLYFHPNLSQVFALDPGSGRWAPRATWPAPGEGHAALTATWTGDRFVAWGWVIDRDRAPDHPFGSAWYDAAADRWTPAASAPDRRLSVSVTLNDGGVLALDSIATDRRVGGSGPDGDDVIDPAHPSSVVWANVYRSDPPANPDPELSAPSGARTAEELAALRNALLGRTEVDAQRIARAGGWELRPVRIDGVGQAGLLDLRPNRVNVSLQGGRVLGIQDIG